MGDKTQGEFQDRLKHYNRKLNKAIHVLENIIYKDIFDTFYNHSYNDENLDLKILIDTLTEVFTKNITRSIQSMKKELFTINAEDFDNLRAYLNRTIYLQQKLNRIDITISDKLIQIILLGKIKKLYIQLYFNLIYNGHAPDYITVLQTFQSLANDEAQ